MNKHIQTFSHGINQDLSTNKYPNTNLYWAENFRVVSKDGLATGALTNVDGNSKVLSIGNGDEQVAGWCLIRDTLVLFVDSSEGGKIFIWEHTNTDYETESPKLIYSDPDLDFSSGDIRAVGRYETANVQKVYFTDGDTFFKHLNIVHPTLGLGGTLDYSIESLDLVSDVDFSAMSLELTSGGNLKAGKIQYAYQLYSKRGSESVFSPTSELIHLTNAPTDGSSTNYKGEEVGTVINKSVIVTIDDIDPGDREIFTRLRLVALEYTVFNQIPSVRIVGEYNIENLTSLAVSDSGTSIGELTLEEFRFIQNEIYPKSLDIKNDYLFAANVKHAYFNISDDDFDARAFRFNSLGDGLVYQGDNFTEITTDWENLPDVSHECYNKFNDWTTDYLIGDTGSFTTFHYKYQSDGATLGGEGPNISYEFTTERVLLDEKSPTTFVRAGKNVPKNDAGVNAPYENYCNPHTPVGLKRDEVYRYGISFRDLKGRPSFVKWIGDIRTPTNEEMPFVYYDSSQDKTYADILGIKFTVDTSNIADQISGFQIVRAERTSADKTIISQGIVASMVNGGMDDDDEFHMYSLASVPYVSDCINEEVKTLRYADDTVLSKSQDQDLTRVGTSLDTDYMELVTPEVVFNKPEYQTSDAYLEVEGYLNTVVSTTVAGPRTDSNDWLCTIHSDKYKKFTGTPDYKYRKAVESYKVYTPSSRSNSTTNKANDSTISILDGGTIFNNQTTTNTVQNTRFGMRGTFALCKTNGKFNIATGNTDWTGYNAGEYDARIFVGSYKVDRGRSIYGGSSYEARQSTTYYPVGEFARLIETPTEGEIPDITREEITTSFTVKHGSLPPYACEGSEVTVWCAFTKPEVGDILYTDAGLTTPFTTNNSVLFTSPSVFGNKPVTIDRIGIPGAITVVSSWCCGDVSGICTDGSSTEIDVFDGDTYINYFWYLRSLWDNDRVDPDESAAYTSDDIIESVLMVPIESSINLDLRLDQPEKYFNWAFIRGDAWEPQYKLMEDVSTGVSTFGIDYPTEVGDLYRYNSAYSAISKPQEYYPKPFDFEETLVNDTRIYASEKKINGEYIDNWTKFKFNNYIDVDSKHNAITKILTFKDNLFFFQPTAVGVVSVNERSLIQDNQAKQLTLGTGGILTRYDYITDKSGSAFYDGIIGTDDFMFYVDGRRKRINKLVPGKEVAVSVVKGIDSTLDKLSFEDVRVGFDRGYNEVIFAIDDVTVAFNETMDAFMSSFSYHPNKMISIGGDFYTTYPFDDESPWLYADPQVEKVGYSGDTDADAEWDYILIGPGGAGEGLYKHNVGDPGVFYGGDGGAADSYLTLILNPAQNQVCYFDNLDLRTESTSSGVDDPDDVFYRLEASNNYQEITKELNFTLNQNQHTGSIKRIGRVWRTAIMAAAASGTSNARMVDTYLKVTLRYDNTSGNTFRVHDVHLYYRPAKH